MKSILAFIIVSFLLSIPARSSMEASSASAQSFITPGTSTADDTHSAMLAIGTASRTSPVPPQETSDSNFVEDDDLYLDEYLFREDVPNGRLPFTIALDRYYSPLITAASIDSNGFLHDTVRQDLVARKLLPEQAT
ncbi:MAG: hypothetical protein M3R61_09745, partial [Chloroflexota bacterium]|nr:hypothetical protein [Chloroflexota bacterium]